MKIPADSELREFVAKLVGWTLMSWHPFDSTSKRWIAPNGGNYPEDFQHPPCYHLSLDAWHDDVWPKILEKGEDFIDRWALCLEEICDEAFDDATPRSDWGRIANATAKQRCLALWNALDEGHDDRSLVYHEKPATDATIMTVAEFREAVESQSFIDYDGIGYPMKDGLMARLLIRPSTVDNIPTDATHINWFNR